MAQFFEQKYTQTPHEIGPLTPHQGKTVEGTCLCGYVVERSLDLGEVSTCQNKKIVQMAGPVQPG